jgi:outer membrane receptor protein involved in Fe transport
MDHWRYATSAQSVRMYGDQAVAGTAAITPDHHYGNTGYFAQAQVNVSDALFLTAGVRAEKNDNFGSAYKTATSPRFGISYARDIGGVTLKTRASYGKAIRAPAPNQRDAGLPTATYVRYANPLLKPETQSGYDAGVEAYFGTRISLQATYYHQTVDQLIALKTLSDPGAALQEQQFQNIGRVRNTGIELLATAQLTRMIAVNGTYSIAHSTVRTLEPGLGGDAVYQYHIGDQLQGVPIQSGGLNVNYIAARLSAGLGATYIASIQNYDFVAYYASRWGGATPRPVGRDYLMTYPTIVKLNFNLSYAFTPHISGLLRVDNLTNSQTFEVSNIIPTYGRRTVAGLRIEM